MSKPSQTDLHLAEFLATFDATELGEGDIDAGANLLAAMAITLGNLARPGSGIRPNEIHLRILKEEGIVAWNTWRNENREIQADLSGVDLSGADLSGADLSDAKFSRTRLPTSSRAPALLSQNYHSNLTKANLTRANLTEANFTRADLTGAILDEAKASGAKF